MQVSLKLNIPREIVEAYEKEGPLDSVLSYRLVQAVNWTAKKPIYIPDEIRQRLDHLFGKNISTAEELLTAVERAVSVKIDNVIVDFLLCLPGYEEQIIIRATQRKLGNLIVWISTAEDLIIQKAITRR